MAVLLDPSDEAATNGSAHEPRVIRETKSHAHPSQSAEHGDFWTAAAPKRLRRGVADADAAWDAYWSHRKAAAPVARLVHAEGTPLAWGWNRAALTEECRALVDVADELARGASPAKFAKGKRQGALQEAVAMWLEAARDGDTNVNFGVGCLAAAHVLHQLGEQLGPELGWPLVDFLAATVADARAWEVAVQVSASSALAQQLVAGELPLTLAYLFPEMAPLAELVRPGRKQLAKGLAELVGDGALVRAGHLDILRGLVACWTRSRAIGQRLEKGDWKCDAQEIFRRVVRQALRWTRASDGRSLLGAGDAPAWSADFLAAAVREGGRGADAAAARELLGEVSLASEVPAAHCKPPSPATWSESAKLALLRTEWSPRATTVAIDFSELGMKLEVAAGRRTLFDGVWTASSHIDGRLLKPAGAWEEVCWFSDADVDYIEFALDLENGAKLERQVMLARTDGFLFLADYLLAAAPAVLEHELNLPLAANLTWQGETETRDAVLTAAGSDEPVARLLPLALPEWRIDPRGGELAASGNAVRLAQRVDARAVACPLFLDLNPRRVAKPCTWRQLTVAELLHIQPPDVAVAYRIQCGKKQWAIYRSLADSGNRTFLGQNTSSEFYAARFLAPSGDVEELVQVEG